MRKKAKLKKPRNVLAVSAHNKKGGAMKDRRKKRGGAKNKQIDILKDLDS